MKAFNFYRQDERGYDVGVSPDEKVKTVQDHDERIETIARFIRFDESKPDFVLKMTFL